MDLEAEEPQQREGALDLCNPDATAICVEHALVHALHAHLDFRGAHAADVHECLGRDGVRPGLDDEAHHTVARGLVAALLVLELLHGRGLYARSLAPCIVLPIELRDSLVI